MSVKQNVEGGKAWTIRQWCTKWKYSKIKLFVCLLSCTRCLFSLLVLNLLGNFSLSWLFSYFIFLEFYWSTPLLSTTITDICCCYHCCCIHFRLQHYAYRQWKTQSMLPDINASRMPICTFHEHFFLPSCSLAFVLCYKSSTRIHIAIRGVALNNDSSEMKSTFSSCFFFFSHYYEHL